MARMNVVVVAALIAGLPAAVSPQEPSASMRFQAQEIYLEGVSIKFGSARQAFTEILRSTEHAGGMVTLSGCGEPDQAPLHTAVRSSLASALDLLTITYPEYHWSIQDGAVDLLPKQNRPAAMDIPIKHLEWDTAATVQLSIGKVLEAGGVSNMLAKRGITSGLEEIPGLQRAPRVVNGVPEPPPQGRTYQIDNVTVLAALNAVGASYGSAFWWYEERNCDGKRTYRTFVQDLRRSK